MLNYLRHVTHTDEEIAQMQKAAELRSNQLLIGHAALVVGYVMLAIMVLHSWLALPVCLIACGVHLLIANRVWNV